MTSLSTYQLVNLHNSRQAFQLSLRLLYIFSTLSLHYPYESSSLSLRFLYAGDTPCLILVRDFSEASLRGVRAVWEENKMRVKGGGEEGERRRGEGKKNTFIFACDCKSERITGLSLRINSPANLCPAIRTKRKQFFQLTKTTGAGHHFIDN